MLLSTDETRYSKQVEETEKKTVESSGMYMAVPVSTQANELAERNSKLMKG